MMRHVVFALLLIGLLVPVAVGASVVNKHYSGRIVGTSPDGHAFTLAGVHHRLPIELTASTRITLITRSDGAGQEQWRGANREAPLSAADLQIGDYATVTTTKRQGHLVATAVVIVRSSATAEFVADPDARHVVMPTPTK